MSDDEKEKQRIEKNNEIKSAREWKQSHPKINFPPIEMFDRYGPELLDHQWVMLTVVSKYGNNQQHIQKGKNFVSESQLITLFGSNDEYEDPTKENKEGEPRNTYFPVFDINANCEVDQDDYLWSRKTLKKYKLYLINSSK